MPSQDSTIAFRGYRGLANNKQSEQLNGDWLVEADNCYLVDNWPVSREGQEYIDDIDSLFVNTNRSIIYVIKEEDLYVLNTDTDQLELIRSDIGAGEYYWCNVLNRTFLITKDSSWILINKNVSEWGKQGCDTFSLRRIKGNLPGGTYKIGISFRDFSGKFSGINVLNSITVPDSSAISIVDIPVRANHFADVYMSDVDGSLIYLAGVTVTDSILITEIPQQSYAFEYINMYPPVIGKGPIHYLDSKIYQAVYDEANDVTEIYCTKPMMLNMFERFGQNVITELGEVTLIIPIDRGIVVGTTDHISIYPEGGKRKEIHYGVPKGNNHAYLKDGRIVIATTIGPRIFNDGESLITDPLRDAFNADYGVNIGGGIIEQEGATLFVMVPFDSNFTWQPPILTDSPEFFETQNLEV